jgi:hypothetical protein
MGLITIFYAACCYFPLIKLFSKILSLYSSINTGTQVSQPYETKGKITFLYVATIMFR